MGLNLFSQPGIESPTVTAFRLPEGIEVAAVTAGMHTKYGVLIGGGLEELRGKIARIGHMGVLADLQPIRTTICALGYTLRELGYEADVQSALEVLARSSA